MTKDKARELISVQVDFAGGYNRHATRLILADVQKDHGQTMVNELIKEFQLDELFGFKPNTEFTI